MRYYRRGVQEKALFLPADPDLLERAVRVAGSMEQSARQLFHSLQRFRELPDYLQIWPGHGAGSACGKALSAVPQSTLGYERRFNWAFGILNEDEFVRAVLAGQPEPPRYFAEMKRMNRLGPRILGGVRRPARLPVGRLAAILKGEAVVVDTRPAKVFAQGGAPGTVNIPLSRSFTTYAGSILPYDRDFYLIIDDRRNQTVDEIARALAGIGLDRIAGYWGTEVIDAWRAGGESLEVTRTVDAEAVLRSFSNGRAMVLDVRGEGEWNAGHIPASVNIPLGSLEERIAEVPRQGPVIVHCQTGARAAIAASLLRRWGIEDVRLYSGGFAEWRAAGHPVERALA
jgi:hydroxyacylglutathione hydrolase